MRHGKATNAALWTLQVVLAGLFLFAGGFKLTIPPAALAEQTGLPAPFMQFIALAEVAGGLGMLLPGLIRVRRELTPLAAAGLTLVMVGAVVISVLRVSVSAAMMPLVVGVLLVTVVRGRRGWATAVS